MPSSPPIARAVAVLNFLGGHPGQGFTLTEIAKSLRISSATCHNLLGTLVGAGYVYRTVAKTYVIGPAISRLAQARLTLDVLMQVVRPEMRLLADEFDLVCSVSFVEDHRILVHERAAALSHIAWDSRGLAPQPFEPPIGIIFLAGSDDHVVTRWIDTARPALDAENRQGVIDTIAFLRRHGFTCGVRTVPLDSSETALSLQNRRDMTDYTLSMIEPQKSYNLAFISAPVFCDETNVALGLSLVGFDHPLKGLATMSLGTRLRAAADRITAFIAGREILGVAPAPIRDRLPADPLSR